MKPLFYYSLLSIFFICFLCNHEGGAAAVGINYGLLGNDLPPPSAVVSRLQQIQVNKIRIFQPNNDVLTALHDSGISVIIGTLNEDLISLASDSAAAATWVTNNILPHSSSVEITCVAAGNEVSGDLTQYIPAAMQNLDSALIAAGLSIPVSTAVSMAVLSASYPPSSGIFGDDVMSKIAMFLESRQYPLLANMYPYFVRVGDPTNVALEYAMFAAGEDSYVHDGENTYQNLFDSMADAVYAALERAGAPGVEVIVAETGWPTEGGADANIENAQIYVNNLIQHVSEGKGTPKRPGKEIQTYIFAMFNENQKAEGVEQHWGLYYPSLTEVYHVDHF